MRYRALILVCLNFISLTPLLALEDSVIPSLNVLSKLSMAWAIRPWLSCTRVTKGFHRFHAAS